MELVVKCKGQIHLICLRMETFPRTLCCQPTLHWGSKQLSTLHAQNLQCGGPALTSLPVTTEAESKIAGLPSILVSLQRSINSPRFTNTFSRKGRFLMEITSYSHSNGGTAGLHFHKALPKESKRFKIPCSPLAKSMAAMGD